MLNAVSKHTKDREDVNVSIVTSLTQSRQAAWDALRDCQWQGSAGPL